jgi:membrane-bound lytic murein transglycosylase MltF
MEMSDLKWIASYTVIIAALLFSQPQQQQAGDPFFPRDFEEVVEKGEITALTVLGFDTYFNYKTGQRGYEYHLAKDLTDSLHLTLIIKTADSADSLKTMLLNGEGELVACNIFLSEEDKKYFLPCGRHIVDDNDTAQFSSWIVRKTMPQLAEIIDRWFEKEEIPSPDKRDRRLFEYTFLPGDEPAPILGNGRISIYDSLFVKYAAIIDWDWRLLASIAFQESKFLPELKSSSDGAVGLMGILPGTAASLGLTADSIFDPESNLRTAVILIERTCRFFSKIKDSAERQKFVIAAYNCGVCHVADAQALAAKYGKNPEKWTDVEEMLKLKNLPEYYNDPVCRCGRLKARQTLYYYRSVMERWEYYKKNV